MITRLHRILSRLKTQRSAERRAQDVTPPHWMDELPPEGMTWEEIADQALPALLRDKSYHEAVERTKPNMTSWDRTASCGHIIPGGQFVYFDEDDTVLCRTCALDKKTTS